MIKDTKQNLFKNFKNHLSAGIDIRNVIGWY